MADRNQSQKRNLAEAAFRINYTALYDVLAQPLVATGLAVKLYSAAIITSETRDAIQTLGNPPARQASWLLQAVEASIKSDYTRLRKFTRVLRKQPVLEPIAKQLHQRYSALVSEARLTESSSSGSDTDSTEQHQSRATASLPAATSVYSASTSQQGSVSLEDYTKRNLKMIQRKFTKLQQNACEVLQLKLNEKEMKKLHLFLVTILPHGFTECLPKSSDLMDIFEAMTHNDLWNHSNYFPLESLIEEFGGDTELTTKLEQFKMDRSSFQIATKIKDYIPAVKSLLAESDEPVEPAPIKPDRKYLWKLGVKLDECVADESLEYLDELWRSLAKTLLLPPVSLVLRAVVEKSILVVWLIPAELVPKAIEIARQSAQFFHSYPILSVTIGDECVYEKEIKGEKKLPQSSSFAHEMQVPRSPSVDKSEELPPMPPAHLPSTTTELNLQAMPSENEAKSAPPILPHVSKPGQHPGTSPKDTEINISGNGIPGGPSSQPPQTPPNKMQHETLPTGAQTQPTSKWTRVKEGALPRLLNLLSPVVHSWGLFALQIGVPTVQISQIQAANPPTNPKSLYTSLTQALQWWINNHDNPTYEVIISVFDPKLGETTPVMNRALASQVRGFMAKEQSPVSLPAATSACIGTGQQGVVSLDDYTKRNLKMIQRKFTKLQQNACEVLQLKLNEKEMKKIHLFLVTILPHGLAECLPNSSDLMDIFEAMTRNNLWNHSNYFPLESLIEEFGGDTELTTQLEQFKMDRSSFQIATKIKDYIPAAKSLLAESDELVEPAPIKPDHKYLRKLGVKLDECVGNESLAYLDELWRSLAKTLRLPPVSLVLHAVVEKSILVVWLIPAELGPKAIEIARQSAEFFRSYPILNVTIGDECVYEKELKGEKSSHEMQVPRSPSVDKSEGRGPSSQPPQTPSKAVPFETPPVSPTGAQTQPTSKHKAQEPFAATAEIEISDLEFGNQIREGGTGIVYKGHWKSRGLDVAIKTTGALEKTEVEHLSSLDHPNIVSFCGVVIKKPHYYIVTELAEHGSLHDYLHEVNFQVDYKQRLKWAMQIAKGMNYLHKKKMMHRDLKPHNVLITKDLTAKICDFGAAKTFEHTTAHTMTGTFRWIAPEVLNEEPYSLQCDVFSFGMILYELIVCKEPFSDVPTMEAVAKIRNGENPDIPESCETFLSNLLTMCWKKDPKARPTFARVMAILDSKGFHELSKIFLQSLQKMVDSMDETSNAAKKAKSALSSLTLQLFDGKTVPLVDPAAYQEARTIPELMKSMSPYWNCLSISFFEAVVNSSGCSASTSALQDFKSARNSSSHLILVAQATTASGDQKALHPLKHHSEKLQSCQPAVFARLAGHQLCASVNVTQISVEVDKAVLHLTDYDHVTEAVVAFLKLPVAALVYCGCSENPLALFWEVSRELVGHISSVIPGLQQYRQLLEYNITTLCVRDELKYSCPNMKDVELWAASSAGHADKILDLLKCVTVDVVDFADVTALVYASSNGQSQAAKALIAEGANVNHHIKDGATPLYIASEKGHSETVQLLLSRGANVNLQKKDGITPLYIASQEGHRETVQLLLSRGANINLQAKNGSSPLSVAASNGHTDVVELLLRAGANTELQFESGGTPLHWASQEGHVKIVEILLGADANINALKKNGDTPLIMASWKGHPETVELLIRSGADVNTLRQGGWTPLICAAIQGHEEVAERLLTLGANPNILDQNQETAVMKAAREGHVGVVTRLLQHRANIKITNKTRETALDIATRAGHTKICEELHKYC